MMNKDFQYRREEHMLSVCVASERERVQARRERESARAREREREKDKTLTFLNIAMLVSFLFPRLFVEHCLLP